MDILVFLAGQREKSTRAEILSAGGPIDVAENGRKTHTTDISNMHLTYRFRSVSLRLDISAVR
jgi:hypothetical protein